MTSIHPCQPYGSTTKDQKEEESASIFDKVDFYGVLLTTWPEEVIAANGDVFIWGDDQSLGEPLAGTVRVPVLPHVGTVTKSTKSDTSYINLHLDINALH